MSQSKLKDLCEYLEKNKEKNYPIGNASLRELPEHLISGYFKMLGVVLQQGGANELQLSLYKRLLAGGDLSFQPEELMRQALDIEIEDYTTFVEDFMESSLRFRFVLDALILTALEKKSEEQVKMITHFVESFQITALELNYLIDLAKCILSQNQEEYLKIRDNCPVRLSLVDFLEYLELFVKGVIVNNSQHFIALGDVDRETEIDCSESINIDSKKVSIRNIIFRIDDKKGLKFIDCESVTVEDSEFYSHGNKSAQISICNCKEVKFTNCSFVDFKNRAIHIELLGKVQFQKCIFKDCMVYYYDANNHWISLGGVIWATLNASCNYQPILIDECIFTGCGGCNSELRYRRCIISNAKCYVKNSRFHSCWHYNYAQTPNTNRIDPEDDRRTLFGTDSISENNEIINSAKFN